MANPEHVGELRDGVEDWNLWRRANPAQYIDLSKTDLRMLDFRGGDLHEANLEGCSFRSARLGGADLRKANFGWANLAWTDLRNADLTEAYLMETSFGNTCLLGAIGLDTCLHLGPSVLDFRTLIRSGTLPVSFLRGCGLSDWEIEFANLYQTGTSTARIDQVVYRIATLRYGPAIQFSSCFLSYSSADEDFAAMLHADLQSNGVRCWFAAHDVKGGRKLRQQIEQAIQMNDCLLLVLSVSSMKSEWVRTELAHAIQRESAEVRQVLFPIRLIDFQAIRHWTCFDSDSGSDLAKKVRDYYIPDFSDYKNERSYRVAFDRLLRDLKTGG